MPGGKLWTQLDRLGNEIYLTDERWAHIVDPDNHPEVAPFLDPVRQTVQLGRRQQDAYDPNSFQYFRAFSDLPGNNSHIVVCNSLRNNDGTSQDYLR